MDSAEISDEKYTTTPIRSDDGDSSSSRRQIFDRGSNQYKTPVRCNESIVKRGKMPKPSSFKNSSFKKMPIYSPPTDVGHVRNPFEHARFLKERLSQPMCSPSLFEKRTSPIKDDQFNWSIEDISVLRPAPINENPLQEFDSWFSPATESEAQKAINKFFSSQVVNMESPVNRQSRFSILEKKETIETWSQTVLTFPPNLPPEIENILARYCTLSEEKLSEDKDEGKEDEDEEEEKEEEFEEEEEEDLDSSNCSNSRKRLAFDTVTDDELECNTPLQVYNNGPKQNVASTPITTVLSSPDLSPIGKGKGQDSPMDISVSFRSKTRLSLTNDVEMIDKENMMSWSCQNNSAQSLDSAFSSV